MIEFFNSCWQWFVDNKENITAFFTSTTFMALVTAIITIIRNTRSKNKNTVSLAQLSEAVASNNSLSEEVKNVRTLNEQSLSSMNNCENEIAVITEKLENLENVTLHKIDAIMEVMSIVYSTIKDDTMRNSVSSILISAKHAGDVTKAELEQEIEDLKKCLQEATENANAIVSDTVDKIKTAVVGSTTENKISRY